MVESETPKFHPSKLAKTMSQVIEGIITIINIYVPNRVSKHMNQKLIELGIPWQSSG